MNHYYTTGVGKSGYVAKLMASFLRSLHEDAQYLCPLGALHGDIGPLFPLLTKNRDVSLYIFTNSGETKEILNLLQHVPTTVKKIVITSNPDSSLAQIADKIVAYAPQVERVRYMPLEATQRQLSKASEILEDIAYNKESTIEELFYKSHPAGEIGNAIRAR